MALLDASPSRERLGRVVELLRGVEEDADARWTAPRRRRRPLVRPRPTRAPRVWTAEEAPPASG
jgi:hypothetical protein